MIGAAFLAIGLLLILAGLAPSASGEAAPTSPDATLSGGARPTWRLRLMAPGWTRHPLRSILLSPLDAATWYAVGAVALGFWIGVLSFVFLVAVFSTAMPLLFIGIGVIILGVGIEGARVVARLERWRAGLADPRPLRPHPYRPLSGSPRELLVAEFGDASRWRDVVYVVVNMPLTILEFVVALVAWAIALPLVTAPLWYDLGPGPAFVGSTSFLGGHAPELVVGRALIGLVLLIVAACVTQGFLALHRAVVAGLLCISENEELERRVATLTESRSAVLDVEASELRRIERDLHDGAQQRLVMLTIDLSLAAERIETDPDEARKLVDDARDQARQALAELRDLVRGIAPSILLDRGLVAAFGAIAGRCRVPTVVDSSLPQGARLPEAAERAAYFVVAEALANVVKHSSAERCEIRCRLERSPATPTGAMPARAARPGVEPRPDGLERLVVEVWDDGQGGASICPGGGLAGLVGRVEALDGRLTIDSPAGGPTLLRAELPLVGAVRAVGPGGQLTGTGPAPSAPAAS